VDDSVDDGDVAFSIVTAAATGGDYAGLDPADVSVTNTDDDPAPSPAPGPTFSDTDGLDVETVTAIERLVDLGVTRGTSDTTFSPEQVVTRWQMALFLVRELEAVGATLPSGVVASFEDTGDLSSETQGSITTLVSLGITSGTSDSTFSPYATVSRWQMALFLARLLDSVGVQAPDAGASGFEDLDGYDVETVSAVDTLVSLGITFGTSDTTFSPQQGVTRAQMAVFLIRVVDLLAA